MITEDFVNFETAKLLKEKGFDKKCFTVYNSDGKFYDTRYGIAPSIEITAPTLQLVMKWLREVHKVAINIGWIDLDLELSWYCIIMNMSKGGIFRDSEYYSSYEDACEAAIKYCLENLI